MTVAEFGSPSGVDSTPTTRIARGRGTCNGNDTRLRNTKIDAYVGDVIENRTDVSKRHTHASIVDYY